MKSLCDIAKTDVGISQFTLTGVSGCEIGVGISSRGWLYREGNGMNLIAHQYNCHSTGPDGAVAMLSANGIVGTGFASRYRVQPRTGLLKGPMDKV